MKITNLIHELKKAQEEGIQHVLIRDNKIYQSMGIDDDFKLIPGKKIFPLSQDQEMGVTSKPTGKVPGDDMGEFAKYMWDQDKGESGMFKHHYDKMREKDWDDPINEQISRIKGMMGLLNEQAETPICSETGCKGTYTGFEFNPKDRNDDVAHKYSNTITNAVAKKLKELYRSGTYVKVDFAKIKLTTAGMGSGNVVYTADIPFIGATDKCDAMTGFAHVGGWGHSPALSNRKSEILNYKPNGKDNVVVDNKLYISNLKTTIEGLEEYFIQWKHRDYQSDCSGASVNNQQTNSAGQSVTIKGIDLDDLRAKISASTKNISIDVSSIKIDAPNFSVSYKPGSEQIKTMSFIWDDRGDLERRFESIQAKNPTMEKIENGTIQNIQWALSIIR